MTKKAKWTLRQQMKDLEEWLRPEHVDFNRDQPRRELQELLPQHEPYTIGLIANRLKDIARWESHLGASAVLQGDVAGWGRLRLALVAENCESHIEYGLYEISRSKGTRYESLNHPLAARSLVLAIAYREDEVADWIGEIMLRHANSSDDFFYAWTHTAFHPFVARLYALWRGYDVTENKLIRNAGVYQGIFDGWGDDSKYVAALLRACDYHCDRVMYSGTEESSEFWEYPFPVFGGEILAAQRVRRELRGSTPEITHPLLDSTLSRVPNSLPVIEDKLVEQAIARTRTDFPNV